MSFTPTAEQELIIAAAKETQDNLIVQALAGAAKTSTLILIAEALPAVQILALSFNKRIQMEMKERLPSNCTPLTLNSLGHRSWGSAIGRKLVLESDKMYNILSAEVANFGPAERKALGDSFAEILKLLSFAKQCGYIPDGHYERGKRLMTDIEFFSHIEQKLNDVQEGLIRSCIIASIAAAMKGEIDFDDQVYMPTLFHGTFPRYPLVLVDEAQDLSALNHAMLRKLVKGRIIAVGDSRQAIYGFRGAHANSMALLAETFQMRELTLSLSFRCPRRVVEHAQFHAPHMRYTDWAEDGSVEHLTEWCADDIPQSATIICRNNAPLFRAAVRLLKNGRNVELGSKDIVKSLSKIMQKFGDRSLDKVEVLLKIDSWIAREKNKTRKSAHGGIEDRGECMRVFALQGDTLGDALAYAHHLANSSGPVKLLTIHKSKGLEFDHVFFLDNELLGNDEQETNLRYVGITRAKKTLSYIDSDNFFSSSNLMVDATY
jgi:superfamily I DNA/RNA helicase